MVFRRIFTIGKLKSRFWGERGNRCHRDLDQKYPPLDPKLPTLFVCWGHETRTPSPCLSQPLCALFKFAARVIYRNPHSPASLLDDVVPANPTTTTSRCPGFAHPATARWSASVSLCSSTLHGLVALCPARSRLVCTLLHGCLLQPALSGQGPRQPRCRVSSGQGHQAHAPACLGHPAPVRTQ